MPPLSSPAASSLLGVLQQMVCLLCLSLPISPIPREVSAKWCLPSCQAYLPLAPPHSSLQCIGCWERRVKDRSLMVFCDKMVVLLWTVIVGVYKLRCNSGEISKTWNLVQKSFDFLGNVWGTPIKQVLERGRIVKMFSSHSKPLVLRQDLLHLLDLHLAYSSKPLLMEIHSLPV